MFKKICEVNLFGIYKVFDRSSIKTRDFYNILVELGHGEYIEDFKDNRSDLIGYLVGALQSEY